MYPVKQSTALDFVFFAFDANGDGVTGKVDGDFTKRISKNGAAFAAMTVTITERENGWYHAQLSTLHTDTLGILSVSFSATGIKRVNMQFRVHARVLDDLAFPNTSGRGMDIDAAGGAEVGSFQAGAITAAAFAAGAIDNAAFNVTETLTANPAAGGITASSFAAGAIDAAAIATDAIGAAELAADAVAEIADAIWDEVMSGHVTVGTYGQALFVATGTADSGTTTTVVDTERTEADTDYWKGALIEFTSGTLAGQHGIVTGFNAATDTITFAPATTIAVAVGHTYRLMPRSRADVRLWLGTAPNALITGRVDANTQAMAAGVIDATAIANAAIDAATFAAGAIDAASIATGAITAAKFAAGAIDNAAFNVTETLTANPAAGGIVAASFAAGAIDAASIATGAITAAKFAAGAIDAAALAADAGTEIATAVHTRQMTEAYAADGVAPTLEQMMYMFWSALAEFAIASTTITCKKLDGTTTAMTFTLDSATTPTSRTRAT